MSIMQKQLQRCQKTEYSAYVKRLNTRHFNQWTKLAAHRGMHPYEEETEIGSHQWKGFASPGHE